LTGGFETKTAEHIHWQSIALAAIILTIPLSCSRSDSFSKADFAVNGALVDRPVFFPALNLSIAPPKGWQAVDNTGLSQFQSMIGSSGLSKQVFPVKPLAVFADTTVGGMIHVAQVGRQATELTTMADRLQGFLASRKEAVPFTTTRLKVNDVKIFLYQMQFTGVINYKILGKTSSDQWFFVEYICRADNSTPLQAMLEAPLATMKTGGTPWRFA
jgi:hypothetical protein